jgi:hypothetical protein
MNNKSPVSFHPQDKSSGSHSTLLIDHLVYKIYNITDEEKKLIEGRLNR